MGATVPLWAFVTLGLAAPAVSLIGIIITTSAESRRSHRNWLRQTKYEAYEQSFTTYFNMKAAFSDFVDAPVVTQDSLDRLSVAATAFMHQYLKTELVASLRVSFYMQMEMFKTWIDVHWQIEAAEVGKPPHKPHREWGEYGETRNAVNYELGVRRDPRWWLGKWRDRGTVVPSAYVRDLLTQDEVEPVISFKVPNPHGEPSKKESHNNAD